MRPCFILDGLVLKEETPHRDRSLTYFPSFFQSRYVKRQDLNIAVLDQLLDSVLPTLVGRVAIIKIDVEGFEPFVFQGGEKLLNIVHPPAILTEVSAQTKGGTRSYIEHVSRILVLGLIISV